MKNIQNAIIQKASLLFARRGTQAIAMDDVAQECCISIKTMYLFFESKDDLVTKVVVAQITKTHQYLSIYNGMSPDAITELNNFFGCIEKMLDIFTPAFLRDIKKHLPDAYRLIENFKNESLIPFIHQNISRGINEETYKTDLIKDMAGKIYSWELHKAMEESYALVHSENQLVSNINNFFLQSLVNSKGKKLLLSK